jgi:cbb3-type cytochrome oxidase subunit 3
MESLPLKDIHLPPDVSVWPLASGWWILIGLILFCIASGFWIYRRLKRRAGLRAANKLLLAIANDSQQTDQQKLTALSALLRRVALSTAPRDQVASLNGPAWLAYLDKGFKDAPFSQGIGCCLADAHYRATPAEVDLPALIKLCQRWLKQQQPQRG